MILLAIFLWALFANHPWVCVGIAMHYIFRETR